MRMVCPRCQHRNSDSAHFCSNCGTPLQGDVTGPLTVTEAEDEATDLAHLPQGELQPGEAVLLVTRGPNAGSRFRLEREVTTIGRNPGSDIFLDDVTVSRAHAEVRLVDGHYAAHDAGSLNGTYVNRQRIEDTELASGDELQVGRFKLVFYRGE
jgi:hypothetical protein